MVLTGMLLTSGMSGIREGSLECIWSVRKSNRTMIDHDRTIINHAIVTTRAGHKRGNPATSSLVNGTGATDDG